MRPASPYFLRFSVIFSIITLLGCVALHFYAAMLPTPEPTLKQPLADVVPRSPIGWTSEDLPHAQSQEAAAEIESLLDYDDTLFRRYQKGNQQILVYISYWKAGKSSVHSVSMHTPDTCWVFTGWERRAREYAISRELNQRDFKPMEYGIYEKDGFRQEVIFWHLAGGEPFRYKLSDSSLTLVDKLKRNFVVPFQTLLDVGFGMNKEQFFIRISSDQPIENLWQDPGFVELMESLEPLGIYQSA